MGSSARWVFISTWLELIIRSPRIRSLDYYRPPAKAQRFYVDMMWKFAECDANSAVGSITGSWFRSAKRLINTPCVALEDLSLASIDLNYDLSWSTNTDNFGSDHFPIIINYKRANSQDINKPFSLKELEIAISHQKNSSPGHDKISLQSINHLPIKAIYLLLKSFNDSWFSSQIPKDWTHALILPFIKPHKNPKEVSSYRPISLTSVIAKLLERMILHRMLDFSFQNKIFHVNHHGFYPHRSSINTLLQLQHDIILARERKEYFILVALDIKAAYDSVWPNGLISKLNKVGYSGRLLRWIQNFLHQRTIQIKWRNMFSKIVTNNYGVPQGSILSPFLFMIYVSDIFEIQHDSHLLVYADDIFLYNSGTNWNETIGEMQESLNKISVWCKNGNYPPLQKKQSTQLFQKKRSTIPPLLKICDKPIPEVKSLKILGIIFDPNTTWKNHINYLRQKGFKYLNAIKALSSPKIGTRSDHLLNIINATIRSIFDYGSQLFSFSSNSNRQKLEPIYNAALRLALGLPRNTPLDLLRAESMNGNINSRHNFLCQKFITKQIALKDWSPNARLFWNINSIFYKYREKEISIFQKTINLLQELCISKVDILQWIPPPPIYDNRKINIYTHELPFQNKDLPDDIVQYMFNDYIQPKFNNNIIIATDGSKNTNQTSIGILIPKKKIRQNFILKDMISIFTAEAIAIWTALKIGFLKQKTISS
ncbi:probable RNA-directed DNA polymerase from transposon BS [Trichonephila clavipes]|nr:probable RNA-directed DNA polymerase from transposon BS [Trichonephila clavipes]